MLIKIHNIIGKGFLSFREGFIFPILKYEGKTLQIDGWNKDDEKALSNGSGKSSLLESINWGFFGELCRKNRYKEEVINKEETECEVIIDFSIDGIIHRLERKQKRKKTPELIIRQISKDSTNLTESLWRDSTLITKQQNLEKIIGMDFTSFVCSVMFGRDFMSFPDLNPSDRANMLTKIMNLEKFIKCSQKSYVALTELKLELQSLQMELKGRESELISLRETNYKKQIQTMEDQRAETIKDLTSKKNSLEKELSSCKIENSSKREKLRKQSEELQNKKGELDKKTKRLPELEETLSQLKESRYKTCNDKDNMDKEINKLKSEIESIKKLGEGRCPRCKQKVSLVHIEQEVFLLHTEIQSKIPESKKYIQLISGIQEQEKVLLHTINSTKELKDQSDQINKTLLELSSSIAVLDVKAGEKILEEKIDQLEKKMDSVKTEINPFIKMEETRIERVKQKASQMKEVKQKVNEVERTRQIYSFWLEGFKKLRFKIFELVKSHFESIAQRILSEYTSELSIRFDTERETKSGTIKDEFHIVVTDPNNQEQSYEMYSGGERQKIRLAVAMALAEMISDQTNREFNFQAFDEPNDALDDIGKEINFDTFSKLSEHGKAVLVTDHDANFKDRFDHSIRVIKKNGRSQIE